MATESPSPEGLSKVEQPEDEPDTDDAWVDKPKMGEMIRGIFLAHREEIGDYNGALELRLTDDYGEKGDGDVVLMWATPGMLDDLSSADVRPGDEIAVAVEETQEIDGEEQPNYEVYA